MILKNVYLTILLLLSVNYLAYTQTQNPYYNQRPEFLKANSVWAFGDSAGIDFNNGMPVPIKTGMSKYGGNSNSGNEGFASVADPVTGKLLFYSNGKSCWNAHHQIMPNGDNLKGNGSGVWGLSTLQGVCIVPVIDAPGKYYLFSLMGMTNSPDGENNSYKNGALFYSVVDMNLQSGLGDIEASRKNVVLYSDSLSESMMAIPGDNCDVWLVVHALGKPEFIAFHITRNGVQHTPVVSRTGETAIRGIPNDIPGYTAYASGSMAVSPDRKTIAVTSSPSAMDWGIAYTSCNGAAIARFDPATGKASQSIVIMDSAQYMFFTPNGVCFSPDNSKLYVVSSVMNGLGLFQFDVSTYDSAAIVNSVKTVATKNFGSSEMSALRSYKEVIYIDDPTFQTGRRSVIGRINYPNLDGAACQYEDSAFSLLDGTRSLFGLGSEVVYPFPADTVTQLALDTLLCYLPESGLVLTAAPGYSSYEWNDGSKEAKRSITTGGTYWVYCTDSCHSRIDTFVLNWIDLVKPEITVNERELGTTLPYKTYQWLLDGELIAGATQSKYQVLVNGFYQVVVTNENDCADTSEVYEVTNVTSIASPHYLSGAVAVYPNPAREVIYITAPVVTHLSLFNIEGKMVRQEQNAKEMTLKGLAEGIYFLQVQDQNANLLKIAKVVKMH